MQIETKLIHKEGDWAWPIMWCVYFDGFQKNYESPNKSE
jgi:hypothetical protein